MSVCLSVHNLDVMGERPFSVVAAVRVAAVRRLLIVHRLRLFENPVCGRVYCFGWDTWG